MKHAGQSALDRLETVLSALRKKPGLKEKSRGVFYRGSRAFLHFHEDGDALFADVRLKDEFVRLDVTKATGRDALLKRIGKALAGAEARSARSR